ncbi:Uncharacterised protein [Mycobacteroides abscessus subsp. abscessus]|nr:Uncharacterised protein [Mycobacteroides abscessus subsp. abscessus]
MISWMASGSGVYSGAEWWRMYWVEWNTDSAKEPKNSRSGTRPAAGT